MEKLDFIKLIKDNGFWRMPHHRCGLCNEYTFYYFYPNGDNITVTYCSGCDCGEGSEIERSIEEAADWYNNLTEEEKTLMK